MSSAAPAGQRYRLYIDESGDHTFIKLDSPASRFLCLLGCFFRADDYRQFHTRLEILKQSHFPHSPDEPLVLHRAEIVNKRGPFWRLRDVHAAASFERDLIQLCTDASFIAVAVVIDKLQLRQQYATPAHPYHLALGFLLQRYCGYLNHIGKSGDVMAESRGGKEDRLLKDSYEWVLSRGIWGVTSPSFFRQALTTGEIKLKKKSENIAGLQLCDILAHPLKNRVLAERGLSDEATATFGQRLAVAVWPKLNRHLYDGRVEGYGVVVVPPEGRTTQ